MTDHLISALFGTARRKKKPLLQGGSQPATSLSHACVSLRRSNEKKMRLLFFFFFFFFSKIGNKEWTHIPVDRWVFPHGDWPMCDLRFGIFRVLGSSHHGKRSARRSVEQGRYTNSGTYLLCTPYYSYEVNDTPYYCKSQSKIDDILLASCYSMQKSHILTYSRVQSTCQDVYRTLDE